MALIKCPECGTNVVAVVLGLLASGPFAIILVAVNSIVQLILIP